MGRSEPIICDPDRSAGEYLDSPNIAFLGYLCTEGVVVIYLQADFVYLTI